jgi:nicotinamide riboside kinase
MKIGIMGAHGCGKTTLARELADFYKDDCLLLSEGARECPFPINQGMSLKSQRWLLARQISMEHYAGCDRHIICDRTVMDPIVYATWMMEVTNNKEFVKFLASAVPFALDWFRTEYDLVVWCRPDGREISDDGFRDLDPDFQRRIDDIFGRMLNGWELDWVCPAAIRTSLIECEKEKLADEVQQCHAATA